MSINLNLSFYLVSFRGNMVPPDSSLLATGPSTVRFWPGCSAASRVWAWTKARPRDWGWHHVTFDCLKQTVWCLKTHSLLIRWTEFLTMMIFTLWVTGLGLLSSSSARTRAKWLSCQIGRPSRLSLDSCAHKHAGAHRYSSWDVRSSFPHSTKTITLKDIINILTSRTRETHAGKKVMKTK